MVRKRVFFFFFSVSLSRELTSNSYATHAWCVECGTGTMTEYERRAHIKWLQLIMFNVYMGNGFRGRHPSSTAAIICLFKHSLFSFLVFLSFVCLFNAKEATQPHSHTSRAATLLLEYMLSSSFFRVLIFACVIVSILNAGTAAALRSPINCIATTYFNLVPATKYTQFCWLIFATFFTLSLTLVFPH